MSAILKRRVFEKADTVVQVTEMQVAQDLQSNWYRNKIPPVFHISKEVMRSYYLGWVVKKESQWCDAFNGHILKIQQVINFRLSLSAPCLKLLKFKSI